jgi:hypothetical protein
MDDEAILTGEVPELFGELLTAVPALPRFVRLDEVVWVNPAHVRAVGSTAEQIKAPRECWVHVGEPHALLVTRSADEVVALLTEAH